MAMKVAKFMRLTQGTKFMTEYLHAFNNLSRYASEFVDTNAKKIASFKRGLSPKMLKSMGTSTRNVFNDFISDCLTQENNNIYAATKNRKRAFELGPSQPRDQMQGRAQYHPPVPGARFKPPQRRNQKQSATTEEPESFQSCRALRKDWSGKFDWCQGSYFWTVLQLQSTRALC
jgi:hypothetical protein